MDGLLDQLCLFMSRYARACKIGARFKQDAIYHVSSGTLLSAIAITGAA